MKSKSIRYTLQSLCVLLLSATNLHAKPHKKTIIEQQDSTVFYQNAPSNANQSNVHVIMQRDLPFIIDEPGEYVLGQNLIFREEGAAITFSFVQNAKLKFDHFSLQVAHANAAGISILDSSEITIQDDAITGSCNALQEPTSVGIHIKRSRKVHLNNLFFSDLGYGLIIEDSQVVRIQDTDFFDALNAGALVRESTNVIFNNDTFADNNIGIILGAATEPNRDIQIIDSSFSNATGMTNLFAESVTGLVINGSSFTSTGGTPGTTTSLVQLGDFAQDSLANNTVIRDSTFTNASNNNTIEGLLLAQGSGFMIDSSLFNINNTGATTPSLAAIRLGSLINPAFSFSNGVIRNSIIQGTPQVGIFAGINTSGLTLENSMISGALNNGISFAGVNNSTLRGNTISNNANAGILLSNPSTSNTLIENIVSGNATGVQLSNGTSFNTLQYNTVLGNARNGIFDQGISNQLWFNNALNNNNQNFITPIGNPAIVTDQGKPTLAGANLKV